MGQNFSKDDTKFKFKDRIHLSVKFIIKKKPIGKSTFDDIVHFYLLEPSIYSLCNGC